MTYSCSIIIPTIDYHQDLEQCLMACNKLKKVKVKMYVVSDKKINKKFKNTIFKSVGKTGHR